MLIMVMTTIISVRLWRRQYQNDSDYKTSRHQKSILRMLLHFIGVFIKRVLQKHIAVLDQDVAMPSTGNYSVSILLQYC